MLLELNGPNPLTFVDTNLQRPTFGQCTFSSIRLQPVRFHIPADAVVCSFLQEQLPLAGRLQYLLVE